MEDKLITIAEFPTGFEAEMAKIALENNDIKAVVVGSDLVTNMPNIDHIIVELQVFEKDADKAKAVLKSQNEQTEDTQEDC